MTLANDTEECKVVRAELLERRFSLILLLPFLLRLFHIATSAVVRSDSSYTSVMHVPVRRRSSLSWAESQSKEPGSTTINSCRTVLLPREGEPLSRLRTFGADLPNAGELPVSDCSAKLVDLAGPACRQWVGRRDGVGACQASRQGECRPSLLRAPACLESLWAGRRWSEAWTRRWVVWTRWR